MAQIINRYTKDVIFESDGSIKETVERAVREKIWLRNANLDNAYLYNANLRNANLDNAILDNAYLRNANLDNANLRWCVGNMREIKTLMFDTYHIVYTHDTLAIGCEQHLISEWKEFTDEQISAMDDDALEWWRKWRDIIFTIIEMSPGVKS